jgi:hypothetical protein
MATNWRQIANELAHALAHAPCESVWRDYLRGDSEAVRVVDFWTQKCDAIGERWYRAEHDALCDDLFNSPEAAS